MSSDVDRLKTRYRQLHTTFGMPALSRSLAEADEAARFGLPGESEPIFAAELDYAKRRGAERRAEGSESPELMLLMVGYSPEPLLLSLAFHAPRRVVLLRSQGLKPEYLETLAQLWNRYHEDLGVPAWETVDATARTVRESPEELFQEVRRLVDIGGKEPSKMLLEITGAKKSMIAGAFLAAGFLDLRVSYVDFDNYDQVLRRPDPETCRPVTLPNPYRLFKLREQDRLAEAFDDRRFGEARRLAEELCEMVERDDLLELLGEDADHQRRGYSCLRQVARGCALWGEGFYGEASETLSTVDGFPMAPALGALGGLWPRRGASRNEIVESLEQEHVFEQPTAPLAYLLDTLVWTDEARAQTHPRAAFLRLFGSLESLFYFTFDALAARSGALQIELENEASLEALATAFPEGIEGPLDWRQVLHGASLDFFRTQSSDALKVLAGPSRWYQPWIPDGLVDVSSQDLMARVPRLRAWLDPPPLAKRQAKRLGRGLIRFKGLRNKVAHWVAPVPPGEVLKLREVLTSAIGELIPLVVASRSSAPGSSQDDGALSELRDWEHRLLATASGNPPADCLPPTFERLKGLLPAESTTHGRPLGAKA